MEKFVIENKNERAIPELL